MISQLGCSAYRVRMTWILPNFTVFFPLWWQIVQHLKPPEPLLGYAVGSKPERREQFIMYSWVTHHEVSGSFWTLPLNFQYASRVSEILFWSFSHCPASSHLYFYIQQKATWLHLWGFFVFVFIVVIFVVFILFLFLLLFFLKMLSFSTTFTSFKFISSGSLLLMSSSMISLHSYFIQVKVIKRKQHNFHALQLVDFSHLIF